MPVTSSNSVVARWPDRETVLAAARAWAAALAARDASVERVGCVGSYPRGDWGVGSDLDVIVIVRDTTLSPHERYCWYCPDGLPVPADCWVYTRAEWAALADDAPHLHRRLTAEWCDLLPPA